MKNTFINQLTINKQLNLEEIQWWDSLTVSEKVQIAQEILDSGQVEDNVVTRLINNEWSLKDIHDEEESRQIVNGLEKNVAHRKQIKEWLGFELEGNQIVLSKEVASKILKKIKSIQTVSNASLVEAKIKEIKHELKYQSGVLIGRLNFGEYQKDLDHTLLSLLSSESSENLKKEILGMISPNELVKCINDAEHSQYLNDESLRVYGQKIITHLKNNLTQPVNNVGLNRLSEKLNQRTPFNMGVGLNRLWSNRAHDETQVLNLKEKIEPKLNHVTEKVALNEVYKVKSDQILDRESYMKTIRDSVVFMGKIASMGIEDSLKKIKKNTQGSIDMAAREIKDRIALGFQYTKESVVNRVPKLYWSDFIAACKERSLEKIETLKVKLGALSHVSYKNPLLKTGIVMGTLIKSKIPSQELLQKKTILYKAGKWASASVGAVGLGFVSGTALALASAGGLWIAGAILVGGILGGKAAARVGEWMMDGGNHLMTKSVAKFDAKIGKLTARMTAKLHEKQEQEERRMYEKGSVTKAP